MAVDKELLERDLYGLLGVGEKASEKEVKTAFRQKALTCHPDKNPDNPRAEERQQSCQDIGVAVAKFVIYPSPSGQQGKFKFSWDSFNFVSFSADLEAREREAQAQENEEEEIRITRSLEEEIIRLREEGSRQLEEQQRLVREQIRLEREQHGPGKQERNGAEGKITPKLKLRWKCRKEDETGGGYSKDVLLQILQKYGDVLNLLISSRKTGSAVVEFATVKAAVSEQRPCWVCWGWHRTGCRSSPGSFKFQSQCEALCVFPAPSQASVVSERDYESLVMMRMRQAAERQQLIEQLQREDEEEKSHT
ncbi:DJC17 protein, partial [Erythrocercus mccallii]|nr:DJC17 protein [Erythrocercus mccallii]